MRKWNRIIALFLSLLLCSTITSVASVVDQNSLENSRFYTYDKFERKWKIYGQYTYEYSDAVFVFGVSFWENYLDNGSPEIRTIVLYDTGVTVGDIVEIKILLDKTIYCFNGFNKYENDVAYQYGGSVLRQFFKTLPVSKEIAIRFKLDNGNIYVIDDIKPDEMEELIGMGELLENSGLWEACQNIVTLVDAQNDASIDGEVPSDEEIESLLNEINATPEPTPTYQTLKKGDKNDEVKVLQLRLIELNYLNGGADGDFGNKTKAAVELFQSYAKLPVTGIADQKTQQALFSDNAPRAKVN